MTLRHLAPAPLLALAVLACTPSVPSNPNTVVVTAEFDPSTSTIPLPNSLAISPDLNPNILAPRNAQEELLGYFAQQGGFPPDQVLSLSFPIATLTVNGPNDVTTTAPDIDLASIVPCTGQQSPGNCNLFVFDALAPGDRAVPRLHDRLHQGRDGRFAQRDPRDHHGPPPGVRAASTSTRCAAARAASRPPPPSRCSRPPPPTRSSSASPATSPAPPPAPTARSRR